MEVHHLFALREAEGVEFSLKELSATDDNGRWFVPAQNRQAITRKYGILQRKPVVPSWKQGWPLVGQLPGTDTLSGIPLSDSDFASRWQEDPFKVLTHLMKKARGGIG